MFNPIKSLTRLAVLSAALILVIAGGCKKESTTTPPAANPVLSVLLVDAPAGYDAVNVDISGLEANLGNGWTALALDNKGVYNLLTFSNGNALPLLNDTAMAPCTISELRLVLGTNNTVVVDGNTYELTTPSGQSSGYKIKMNPQPMVAGGTYRLVLDFNAAKSITETGNGKYLLKPVVTGYLLSSVGSITGSITPVTGSSYCEAASATDTVGTYINAGNGAFLFPAVMPGTYSVTFFPNTGFSAKTVNNVIVSIGHKTQMGTITLN